MISYLIKIDLIDRVCSNEPKRKGIRCHFIQSQYFQTCDNDYESWGLAILWPKICLFLAWCYKLLAMMLFELEIGLYGSDRGTIVSILLDECNSMK